MITIPALNTSWWYGRAIRIYFLISILISIVWIFQVLYNSGTNIITNSNNSRKSTDYTNNNTVIEGDKTTGKAEEPAAAASNTTEAYDLQPATTEFRTLFTDHIYCVNEKARRGKRGRMNELFKLLEVDVEMYSRRRVQHQDIWRDMLEKGYSKAVIFEDDIDFEFDVHQVVNTTLSMLESRPWDILYIGHCSVSEEKGKRVKGRLNVAKSPFCMSGYILSRNGARKLFAYFSRKPVPRALDVSMVAMIKRKLLSAYSVFPPVVYQRRDLYPSDDGLELKIAEFMRSSVWDANVNFYPPLINWTDPLDSVYLDPAYKNIPSWMEDHKANCN